jgi:hypothetical protein
MKETRPRTSWLEWFIVVSCAAFVFILALSAAYNHSILVLHFFQALTYVAVVILTLRRSAWGVWRWLSNRCVLELDEHFLYDVHRQRIACLGLPAPNLQLARPDQLIAVIAAARLISR